MEIEILKKLLLTEKVSNLNSKGVYGFIVDVKANKIEIKKAVEKRYSVIVLDVNTIVCRIKRKIIRSKFGANFGTKNSYKKALVRLKDGDFINIL
jgi:large subunit ribosomal protein L23